MVRVIILASSPWQINPKKPEFMYGYTTTIKTPPKPKVMLHHNGIVLLDNQVKIINSLGVDDIRIVINYKKELIIKHITDNNLGVKPIVNPNWEHPATSIEMGAEGAEGDIIVLFGDIWLTEESMKFLIESKAQHTSIWSPSDSGQFGYFHGVRIKKDRIESFIEQYKKIYVNDIKAYNFKTFVKSRTGVKRTYPDLKDFDVYEWTEDYVKEESDNKIVGYAFVVGDLLHYGHINFFNECKKHCDILIVGVYTDELTESYKRRPIIPLSYRLAMLNSLSSNYVDATLVVRDRSCIPALKFLASRGWRIAKLFHGTDWNAEKDDDLKASKEYIESIGGELIQPEYYKNISTTMIIEEIVRRYGKQEKIDD